MMERELKIELDELLAQRATLDRRISRARNELTLACSHPWAETRHMPSTTQIHEVADCGVCGARLSNKPVSRG